MTTTHFPHHPPVVPQTQIGSQPARDLPAHKYQQRLAMERPAVWRGIVALVLLMGGLLAFSAIGGAIGLTVDLITGRWDPSTTGTPGMTPALLAGSLGGLAMLTPWSMLLQKWLFKVPARSLHSVRNLFRWRLLARTALIVIPIWVAYQVITLTLMPQPTTTQPLVDTIALLVLAVTLTPLQSAGEEYAFRGLTFRIAASWGWGPRTGLVLGILVGSALFMVAHAALDPWLNIYYFVFGAALAVITWRTGGLELAVLLHAVNNTVAFVITAVMSYDLNAGFDRSAGVASPVMLIPCALLIVVAGVVWWRTRTGAATSQTVTRTANEG